MCIVFGFTSQVRIDTDGCRNYFLDTVARSLDGKVRLACGCLDRSAMHELSPVCKLADLVGATNDLLVRRRRRSLFAATSVKSSLALYL